MKRGMKWWYWDLSWGVDEDEAIVVLKPGQLDELVVENEILN